VEAVIDQKDNRQKTFEALLDQHEGIVFRVLLAYAASPEDREDLAQDIRLELWRAFPGYEPCRSFSTWMFRVALNTAISWSRKASLRKRWSAPWPKAEPFAAAAPDVVAAQALRQLVQDLGEIDRALVLLYLEDRPTAEIAEILGMTPQNTSVRLTRLKQSLRAKAQAQETPSDSPNQRSGGRP
jgi:RNA polymerase sigma factor (sigma-70 family)